MRVYEARSFFFRVVFSMINVLYITVISMERVYSWKCNENNTTDLSKTYTNT